MLRFALRTQKYNCGYNFALKDPYKHNTMNHSYNSLYIDLWDYGEYPEIIEICSQASKNYQSQVVKLMIQVINQKYGSNIDENYLMSKKLRNWNRFLKKDLKVQQEFHELYPAILSKLATSIFIRQSRYTWIKQQQLRLTFTQNQLSINPIQTIEEFLTFYNNSIEELVLFSNAGYAAEIDQEESAQQKHQIEQMVDIAEGVQDLKNLAPENNNVINKLLAYIH